MHGSTIRKGEVSVNATRISGNASIGKELSNAATCLREDVFKMVKIFKENASAFENCYLIDTAPQVGIRETRTIIGEYTMTAEDVLTPQAFFDTVAKGGHPVDIHRSGTSQQDVRFIEAPYDIPYRSLIPKGSVNVLVAGGCISATREAFASIRVQAQCMALGQAAGTAAALCTKMDDISFTQLNGGMLRKILSEQGAIV